MILKRAFDISISLIALILLIPIFILIALAIKIDSSGPILFTQQRVGKNQKLFIIHKFRSMRSQGSKNESLLTVGNDDRITRVGKVLRDTKLDELPQMLDVLIGKMSFVGPRPEVPRFVKFYTLEQKKVVFSVRPGLTDIASILFINEAEILGASQSPEESYISIVMPIKIKLAMDYVNNQKFWFDIHILFKTITRIIRTN